MRASTSLAGMSAAPSRSTPSFSPSHQQFVRILSLPSPQLGTDTSRAARARAEPRMSQRGGSIPLVEHQRGLHRTHHCLLVALEAKPMFWLSRPRAGTSAWCPCEAASGTIAAFCPWHDFYPPTTKFAGHADNRPDHPHFSLPPRGAPDASALAQALPRMPKRCGSRPEAPPRVNSNLKPMAPPAGRPCGMLASRACFRRHASGPVRCEKPTAGRAADVRARASAVKRAGAGPAQHQHRPAKVQAA